MYKLSFIAAVFLLLIPVSASAEPCPDITVHVDNDVPGSGYTETNGFNWASRPTGACSGTYRYLSHDKQVAPNNDGTRKGKAYWKPKITVTGNYEVTISYRATVNRTKDADYIVHDDKGGKTHQVIDQAHTGDCTYVKLGTFYCKAGGDCRVELDGTDGLRVVSNIVGADPSEVRIGMRVEVFFEHMSDELVATTSLR